IRAALDTLPSRRTPTRRDWEGLSRGWRDELDRQIGTLHAIRNRLTTCIGCGCLSIDKCELLNPEDEAGGAGPGADYPHRDGAGPLKVRQSMRLIETVLEIDLEEDGFPTGRPVLLLHG